MFSREQLQQKLQARSPRRLEGRFDGEAAVLVTLVERNDQPHFLLTRRTMTVATHKGQISFPGGMREDQDATFQQTALRETREELGIEPHTVELLGEFDEYQAVTNQRVKTFVGVVPPDVTIEPQQTEVAYVLEVPWEFFTTTKPRIEQKFRLGRMHDIYFYDFGDEVIWGLTARMIRDFLDVVG